MVPYLARARAWATRSRARERDGGSIDRPHHRRARCGLRDRIARAVAARMGRRANNRITRDRVVANQIIGPRARAGCFLLYIFFFN